MSEGSAPTVAGSEKGGGPSSVSEGASATSGDNIRGLKEALQRKKEALVARKRELDSGPLRVTRSDEVSWGILPLRCHLSIGSLY